MARWLEIIVTITISIVIHLTSAIGSSDFDIFLFAPVVDEEVTLNMMQ